MTRHPDTGLWRSEGPCLAAVNSNRQLLLLTIHGVRIETRLDSGSGSRRKSLVHWKRGELLLEHVNIRPSLAGESGVDLIAHLLNLLLRPLLEDAGSLEKRVVCEPLRDEHPLLGTKRVVVRLLLQLLEHVVIELHHTVRVNAVCCAAEESKNGRGSSSAEALVNRGGKNRVVVLAASLRLEFVRRERGARLKITPSASANLRLRWFLNGFFENIPAVTLEESSEGGVLGYFRKGFGRPLLDDSLAERPHRLREYVTEELIHAERTIQNGIPSRLRKSMTAGEVDVLIGSSLVELVGYRLASVKKKSPRSASGYRADASRDPDIRSKNSTGRRRCRTDRNALYVLRRIFGDIINPVSDILVVFIRPTLLWMHYVGELLRPAGTLERLHIGLVEFVGLKEFRAAVDERRKALVTPREGIRHLLDEPAPVLGILVHLPDVLGEGDLILCGKSSEVAPVLLQHLAVLLRLGVVIGEIGVILGLLDHVVRHLREIVGVVPPLLVLLCLGSLHLHRGMRGKILLGGLDEVIVLVVRHRIDLFLGVSAAIGEPVNHLLVSEGRSCADRMNGFHCRRLCLLSIRKRIRRRLPALVQNVRARVLRDVEVVFFVESVHSILHRLSSIQTRGGTMPSRDVIADTYIIIRQLRDDTGRQRANAGIFSILAPTLDFQNCLSRHRRICSSTSLSSPFLFPAYFRASSLRTLSSSAFSLSF